MPKLASASGIFKAVKHDLWDRDFPSPPVLVTVKHDGQKIDAVAQTTKQGFVFLFDRTNGKPLFPIECRNYPPSDVPGEVAAQATVPAHEARALLAANAYRRSSEPAHSGRSSVGRGYVPQFSQRWTVRPVQRRQRHRNLSRIRRRGRVGRRCGRSRDRDSLRQRERRGLDRRSRGEHFFRESGEHSQGALHEPMRRVPWRDDGRIASGDSSADGPRPAACPRTT